MGDFFPADSTLGTLELESVFRYYDGPVLFTARNDLDQVFLVVAADHSNERTTYVYVPMSEQRLTAVRTGLVSLRDAFSAPERDRAAVVYVSDDVEKKTTVEQIAPAELPDDWLPEPGRFLSEAAETAMHFDQSWLVARAGRENRYLVAVEVDVPEAIHRTELPLRIGGPLLTEMQELADGLSAESDLALVDLAAASFVFILSPTAAPDRMFSVPSQGITQIMEVLEAAAGEAFGDYVAENLRPRPQSKVRHFFTALSDANTGVTVTMASPGGEVVERELPLARVRQGIALLRSTRDSGTTTFQAVGHLMGINHTRRRFNIRTIDSVPGYGRRRRNFSGTFDATVNIDGVASGESVTYLFTVVEEQEVPEFDEEQIQSTFRMTAMELVLVAEVAHEDQDGSVNGL